MTLDRVKVGVLYCNCNTLQLHRAISTKLIFLIAYRSNKKFKLTPAYRINF